MGRYEEVVPEYIRELAASHGLPKPNWFISSSEAGYFSGELSPEIDGARPAETSTNGSTTNGHGGPVVDFEDPYTFAEQDD